MNDHDNFLLDLCLTSYLGMSCIYCGRKFSTLKLLKESNPICAEKDENGIKLACKFCFEENKEKNDILSHPKGWSI
jgi:hypothetical protein